VPDLPPHPSLEYLRKQAKTRKRERGIGLSQAQHQLAREYGFASWPQLVRHVQSSSLEGIERALVLADTRALARLLHACAHCWTAAWRSTAAAGATSRRWSRPPCTDAPPPCGCSSTAAQTCDCAFDEDGPIPLDCALWGLHNNRAADGDYPGTVQALLAAGAPTRQSPPTGDETIDALLATRTTTH
jgi:hypothetical protein